MSDSKSDQSDLQKRLNILVDLKKINGLRPINIPQDDGSSLVYCTLAEATQGTTPKISLISLEKVKAQLKNWCNQTEDRTVNDYINQRERYKLSIEAIIKLPKHDDIKEVQREAIALNLSRLMGLDTSASTTVSVDGRPALFIPFADIRLLRDFSIGKTFVAGLGITGQTYTHYSTIKPIGEGIHADCFISDFGDVMGLFYLCSDPDAIGGYCQNKALKNARSLFIFDQVIMDSQNFSLDSRMSLKPQGILKHTRHGIGRNRTLIEDSSLNTKYASMMQLRKMSDKIAQYIEYVAVTHHRRAAAITEQMKKTMGPEIRNRLKIERDDVISLKDHANQLKAKIQQRIDAIEKIFPQTTDIVTSIELRQVLVFEKLVHNPRLFSDDGRPYKYPWTKEQKNRIKQIDDLGNGNLQLTFSDKVPEDTIRFIKRRSGSNSITITSPQVITISKTELLALTEDILYPEHQLTISHAIKYLDPDDLTMLKAAYTEAAKIITEAITVYNKRMQDKIPPNEKIDCIMATEIQLKEHIAQAKDKGFGMHVLKKFYFDAQQQLQIQLREKNLHQPENLDLAFTAALKLDKIALFNKVIAEAIKQNKTNDELFTQFLEECIHRVSPEKSLNYTQAQQESSEFTIAAEKLLRYFNIIPTSSIAIIKTSSPKDGLDHVNPIAAYRRYSQLEHHMTIQQRPHRAMTTIDAPPKEIIINSPGAEIIK